MVLVGGPLLSSRNPQSTLTTRLECGPQLPLSYVFEGWSLGDLANQGHGVTGGSVRLAFELAEETKWCRHALHHRDKEEPF